MKELIQYQSDSGAIFSTKEAAQKEDLYFNRLKAIDSLLPDTTPYSFANGEGYLQCEAVKVDRAKEYFLLLTSEYYDKKFTNVAGIVGRFISDGQTRIFDDLVTKLCSIDSQNRMWGQIYYAAHSGQGNDKCLNG